MREVTNTMDVQRLVCVSCGAPIDISADTQRLKCAYCGVTLAVERSEGHVALRTVEQVRRIVEDAGAQTQAELRRLDLGNQLQTAQLQLSSIQAEIRSLQREPASSTVTRQLRDLRGQEAILLARLRELQALLATPAGATGAGALPVNTAVSDVSTKDWTATFLLCLFFGVFGVHRFYTGHMVAGVLQLLTLGGFYLWWLFDLFTIAANRFRDSEGKLVRSPSQASGALGMGCITAFVLFVLIMILLTSVSPDLAFYGGLLVGFIAFLYVGFPNAGIWQTLGLRKKT
jgi:predicted RNA-binding Zn-ribbon protein involved in translation (DUF1610 family)